MAAKTKPAAKKSTTKKAATSKSTKAAKTEEKAPPKRKAWIGANVAGSRLGQQFSIAWRVAGKPSEFVSLWQEGPDGNFHYTVPVKGSRLIQAAVGGKYAWSIHGTAGEELARVEVAIRA